MITKASRGILLSIVALVAACGSSAESTQTTPVCVGPPSDPACDLAWNDPASLVRDAFVNTDGTSTGQLRLTGGRICMSGTVNAAADDSSWGAMLVLAVTDVDPAARIVEAPFDAVAAGAQRLRFAVATPPLSGVLPQIGALTSATCTQIPDCLQSFSLPSEVVDPGTATVALSDYTVADGGHPGAVLDPTLITHLQFYVATLPGLSLDYAFCLDGIAFLRADGHEVAR